MAYLEVESFIEIRLGCQNGSNQEGNLGSDQSLGGEEEQDDGHYRNPQSDLAQDAEQQRVHLLHLRPPYNHGFNFTNSLVDLLEASGGLTFFDELGDCHRVDLGHLHGQASAGDEVGG